MALLDRTFTYATRTDVSLSFVEFRPGGNPHKKSTSSKLGNTLNHLPHRSLAPIARNLRRYNYTGEEFFVKKKDRGFRHVTSTAKLIIREALPIQCVDAVFLGAYLTSEMTEVIHTRHIPVLSEQKQRGKTRMVGSESVVLCFRLERKIVLIRDSETSSSIHTEHSRRNRPIHQSSPTFCMSGGSFPSVLPFVARRSGLPTHRSRHSEPTYLGRSRLKPPRHADVQGASVCSHWRHALALIAVTPIVLYPRQQGQI